MSVGYRSDLLFLTLPLVDFCFRSRSWNNFHHHTRVVPSYPQILKLSHAIVELTVPQKVLIQSVFWSKKNLNIAQQYGINYVFGNMDRNTPKQAFDELRPGFEGAIRTADYVTLPV